MVPGENIERKLVTSLREMKGCAEGRKWNGTFGIGLRKRLLAEWLQKQMIELI